MGAGVSRHGQVRRKVQAVNAFEDAGKRHRRKKKNHKKSDDVIMRDMDPVTSSEQTKSHWLRVKERTISKTELESRSALRLSDFNKVVRKRTLEKEDDVPICIPYVSNEKVCCVFSQLVFLILSKVKCKLYTPILTESIRSQSNSNAFLPQRVFIPKKCKPKKSLIF